jgi:outer membrane protein
MLCRSIFSLACFFLISVSFAEENNYSNERNKPINLSLREAILLSVRDNPNVQTTELDYIAKKCNLFVQEWMFYPHFNLGASGAFKKTNTHHHHDHAQNVDLQGTVKVLTPIGTTVEINSINTRTSSYNPGLTASISQPLLRGFGTAVVEAALHDAMDSALIGKLNIEDTLRTTVTNVINAYLDIVFAQQTILIDEKAVQRAAESVKQTKLFIKAGHKAGNELITVEANVASAKSNLENDKNNLAQSKYALLAAIGLDPNMQVRFGDLSVKQLIKNYHLTSLAETKKSVLENSIQYQISNITLNGSTSRSLLLAEDNARWQLDLTATAATGHGTGHGQNAGTNSLFNGVNQSQSIGLTLQIPIDDQVAKQAILNAKIAMRQARIALKQQRWEIETQAINGWNSVLSAERALRFAENAEKLQAKTYNISYQKYTHGLIDSLELQTAQVQLIQSQQNLLSNQVNYLKALVNLDLLIGRTLKTWNIAMRKR